MENSGRLSYIEASIKSLREIMRISRRLSISASSITLSHLSLSKVISLLIGRLPAIASAATTAAPKTTTTTGPAASARTLFLGLVNLNVLTIKARAIHLGHRRFSILILSEGHEPKAPGTPRIPVGDDLGFGDFPVRRERLAQSVVRRVPAQPPYK
jgi:hypothetical protein